MLGIRPETETYLTNVERYVSKKFRYRIEVGILIDIAEERSLRPQFEELLFLAKFVTNAQSILQRSGIENEQTAKLSAEFSSTLQKFPSMISALTSGAVPEVSRAFPKTFFDQTQESMQRLMVFLSELSWIKNYFLDQGDSPFSCSPHHH